MKRRGLLAGTVLAGLPGLWPRSGKAQQAGPLEAATQAPKLDDSFAPGYKRITIASWGDGVLADAPAFNPLALNEDQAASQLPYDNVIAGILTPPLAQDNIPRLVMVLASPAVPVAMVFASGQDDPGVAGKMQGASILNLQYVGGTWVSVDGGYQSRRLDDGTLCQITGPAAAAIGDNVQGLLAPVCGCTTAWGRALLAEGDTAPWLTRLAGTDYGIGAPSSAPKFGWVVEFDPLDPGAIPAKRTALGRMARAGIAATRTHDGRAVIFMSQLADAGYFFRFVAATNAADGTMLDSGTLAVAQINDTQIAWVNLPGDSPGVIGVLGNAAQAGGSVFDAPGGIAVGPDGRVYLACRGNPGRAPEDTNPLNPRAGDDNGHVIVFTPAGGDVTAASYEGEIALAAGDPAVAAFTQYAAGSECWLKNPCSLNLDAKGQLWIGTDQGGKISGTADGLFVMQTGENKFQLSNAYFAPVGAAMGAAAFDVASSTVFTMVRHPGAVPGASFNNPATRWPTLQASIPPQSTLIGLLS